MEQVGIWPDATGYYVQDATLRGSVLDPFDYFALTPTYVLSNFTVRGSDGTESPEAPESVDPGHDELVVDFTRLHDEWTESSVDYPHEANQPYQSDPTTRDVSGDGTWELYGVHDPDGPGGDPEVNRVGALASVPEGLVSSWVFTNNSDDLCDANEWMLLNLDWTNNSAGRKVPASAECLSGSGSFFLAPVDLYDQDGDGSFAAVHRPIMLSGSGTLTNAAWITSIELTDPLPVGLRVIRANHPFTFDDGDHLNAPGVVGIALSGSQQQFATGVISGLPAFVADEVPATADMDAQVDMTWQCSSTTPLEEVFLDAGYTFSLGDIGCSTSPVQKFTIRPVPALAPKYLAVELYGDIWSRQIAYLRLHGNEQRFNVRRGPLHVKGALLSMGPNGAQLRLDQIEWNGSSVCSTGTYTLPVE